MKRNLIWNTEMPLIRYGLEVVPRSPFKAPEHLPEFTHMAEILKRARPSDLTWLESKTPLFHPGRVLVSNQVMVHLGREEVLSYLNVTVRGGWEDGPCAGLACQAAFYNQKTITNVHWLSDNLSLWIVTNSLRTVTVMRFGHERLKHRRAAANERAGEVSLFHVEDEDEIAF